MVTSEYGANKQHIKRARSALNKVVGHLAHIEMDYAEYECFQQWFAHFKPLLITTDEALKMLLEMLVDPTPFEKAIKHGNASKSTD